MRMKSRWSNSIWTSATNAGTRPSGSKIWPVGWVCRKRPCPRSTSGLGSSRWPRTSAQKPDEPEDPELARPTHTHRYLAMEPAEVVVGGAGALRGDHAGADRRLGRACGPEHLALPGFDHALEDLAALAGLGVGDPDAGHLVQEFGVPGRELRAQPQRALGDESQAPP